MLKNVYHVEAFLLILTLKKNIVKKHIQLDGFHAYT